MALGFFIVGCGRSGTTMLRTMLNLHPKIGVPPESLFIADYLRAKDRVSVERMRRLICREPELRHWDLNQVQKITARSSSIEEIVEDLHMEYAGGSDKLAGQKTPRFVRYLDIISAAYPDAKFIHLVRDPRSVVASLKYSPNHRLPVPQGAARWVNDVELGLHYEAVHPDKVIRVQYEELIEQPEATLRGICTFIGVEYDPGMVELGKAPRDFLPGGFYEAGRKMLGASVKKDKAEAWRTRLSQPELAIAETICMPLMIKLSYQPVATTDSYTNPSRLPAMIGRLRLAVHYLRHRTDYIPWVFWRRLRLGLPLIGL